MQANVRPSHVELLQPAVCAHAQSYNSYTQTFIYKTFSDKHFIHFGNGILLLTLPDLYHNSQGLFIKVN